MSQDVSAGYSKPIVTMSQTMPATVTKKQDFASTDINQIKRELLEAKKDLAKLEQISTNFNEKTFSPTKEVTKVEVKSSNFKESSPIINSAAIVAPTYAPTAASLSTVQPTINSKVQKCALLSQSQQELEKLEAHMKMLVDEMVKEGAILLPNQVKAKKIKIETQAPIAAMDEQKAKILKQKHALLAKMQGELATMVAQKQKIVAELKPEQDVSFAQRLVAKKRELQRAQDKAENLKLGAEKYHKE